MPETFDFVGVEAVEPTLDVALTGDDGVDQILAGLGTSPEALPLPSGQILGGPQPSPLASEHSLPMIPTDPKGPAFSRKLMAQPGAVRYSRKVPAYSLNGPDHRWEGPFFLIMWGPYIGLWGITKVVAGHKRYHRFVPAKEGFAAQIAGGDGYRYRDGIARHIESNCGSRANPAGATVKMYRHALSVIPEDVLKWVRQTKFPRNWKWRLLRLAWFLGTEHAELLWKTNPKIAAAIWHKIPPNAPVKPWDKIPRLLAVSFGLPQKTTEVAFRRYRKLQEDEDRERQRVLRINAKGQNQSWATPDVALSLHSLMLLHKKYSGEVGLPWTCRMARILNRQIHRGTSTLLEPQQQGMGMGMDAPFPTGDDRIKVLRTPEGQELLNKVVLPLVRNNVTHLPTSGKYWDSEEIWDGLSIYQRLAAYDPEVVAQCNRLRGWDKKPTTPARWIRWHGRYAGPYSEFLAILESEKYKGIWTENFLPDAAETYEGWAFEHLAEASQILDEGVAMNHCVAGYVEAVVQERMAVWHIRAPGVEGSVAEALGGRDPKQEAEPAPVFGGDSLMPEGHYTLALSADRDPEGTIKSVAVLDYRGGSNSVPSQEAWDALAGWLRDLTEARINWPYHAPQREQNDG